MKEKNEYLIGNGTFGHVFKSNWKQMPAAIKILYPYPDSMMIAIKKPSTEPEALQILANEIAIHRQLNHPNIVTFLCAQNNELVMELIAGNDLLDTLDSHRGSVSYIFQLSVARDIARGLHYLHDSNILHRDLKCDNILLERRGKSIIAKICDFGFATLLDKRFYNRVGTPEYIAPEIYDSRHEYPYSIRSDIYAFSIILWWLMYQKYPFQNVFSDERLSQENLAWKVVNGERDKIPQNTSPDFAKLITDCWKQNPIQRPMTLDIINRLTEMLRITDELYFFAKNTENLTEARKIELLALLNQHPYFLTLLLDDEGNTFLHHVFATNNLSIINELLKLPQWDTLSKIKNTKNGLSLFDQIAVFGHEEHYELLKPITMSSSDLSHALILAIKHGKEGFCNRLLLDGADPNTQYHDDRPLILAASKGHANICILLLGFGADPFLKNNHNQTAEQCWTGLAEDNPFIWFRSRLILLAKNTGDLSELTKTKLLHIITRYLHLLTWELDDQGNTFLHNVFASHNSAIINELAKLPQWDELSKTENIRNNQIGLKDSRPIIQLTVECNISPSSVKFSMFNKVADRSTRVNRLNQSEEISNSAQASIELYLK